jgi:hypothetical protein
MTKKFESLLEAKRAAKINADLTDILAVLHEVTGALMCEDIELRALTRDFIVLYMQKLENFNIVPNYTMPR